MATVTERIAKAVTDSTFLCLKNQQPLLHTAPVVERCDAVRIVFSNAVVKERSGEEEAIHVIHFRSQETLLLNV
ncbi:hypothetical protein GCM10027347_04070 [Larkinella harenae]